MSRYQEEMEKLKKVLLRDPFPYWVGAILLAVLNISHFATYNHGWGITSSFALWGAWIAKALGLHPETWAYFQVKGNAAALQAGFMNDGGTWLNIGIIFGAFLATLLASQFRVKKIKNYKQVIGAVAGGLFMGYGARIAYGWNIGALFSGTASMSLHGWVFLFALPIGAYIGSKFLVKYLI